MLVGLAILLVVVLVVQHRVGRSAGKERPVARHDALVLPPHLAESLRTSPSFVRPSGKASAGSPPPAAPSSHPLPPRDSHQ